MKMAIFYCLYQLLSFVSLIRSFGLLRFRINFCGYEFVW